jgi:hypothetical protein
MGRVDKTKRTSAVERGKRITTKNMGECTCLGKKTRMLKRIHARK